MSIKISPSVGVARLGNSTTQICLSPDSIGGLPFDADANGNKGNPVTSFRDAAGRIKRQGQLFKIFDGTTELLPGVGTCTKLEWTVHLANKKGAWRQYSELEGNLLYGPSNSYDAHEVEWRNGGLLTEPAPLRRPYLIDPGPRTLDAPNSVARFDRASSEASDYPSRFPNYEHVGGAPTYGSPINTLGEIRTDAEGRLIVLGGYGHSGGNQELENYGGQNTWHDDISDGPVFCTVHFTDKNPETYRAWVIVGSPDFAPEIVNISNLSDTMFDVAVRHLGKFPDIYTQGAFVPTFAPNFERDIAPILKRMENYQWVSNVQPMQLIGAQRFDYADKSDSANAAKRQAIFSMFRGPNGVPPANPNPDQQPQQKLFVEGISGQFPGMPLNSGSNSVSNTNIVKFLALNETQYFFMQQWAAGIFDNTPPADNLGIDPADQAQVGNCVGLPMCPGIEVTWSLQNPVIYDSAYTLKHFKGVGGYDAEGLDPNRDECEAGTGLEPGDLTKRMANPWQADFFQCTIQYINYTDPRVNKGGSPLAPVPPTYYSYWWPPQSPWDVLVENSTMLDGNNEPHYLPMGEQMNYQRGINSFNQMIEYWYALGFLRDLNPDQAEYPYFLETERLNDIFRYEDYPISNITGNPDDQVTIPVFYIEEDTQVVAAKSERAALLVAHLEEVNFKKVKAHPDGLPHPKRGTLRRR